MDKDGSPKDYSRMYCEDSSTGLSHVNLSNSIHKSSSNTSGNNNNNTSNFLSHNTLDKRPPIPPPIPSSRNHRLTSSKNLSDGSYAPKYYESSKTSGIDLRRVVDKLQNFSKENSRAYAMDTLSKHYSSVFVEGRKTNFKAYIQYFDEKDTYVVRVNHNTLRAVKEKMPKRGNYRYFFKSLASTCEEAESDESTVPFHEKDGLRQIYCQVFPF